MNEFFVLPLRRETFAQVLEDQVLPMVQVHPGAAHVTQWLLYDYESDTISWGAVSDGWEQVKEGTLWRKAKTVELYELAEEMTFTPRTAADILDTMRRGPAVAMPYVDTVAIHHRYPNEYSPDQMAEAAARGRLELIDHPLLEVV